ncbi:hypothetical protein [Pseudobacteroides cellulosolvens]|uniref:Right handed beta helix domain-containing protein n=1 Tax=Pseudobacteroides cellulosolvens ATCC 35603 = DSM 2933 TaxID=398512 RepID=A0A0L6JU76_9FIRM|nr:hypothetical protein [Pseudobacteroides cellulosolvens]KNY29411.1 hypothetical protein Bccel_4685 [Pseudobacteroides cellulosolvens ATCC 35603 = DSM 2933]
MSEKRKVLSSILLFLLLFLLFCTQVVIAKKSPDTATPVPSTTPLSSQVPLTPVSLSTELSNAVITSNTIWDSSGNPYIIKDKLIIDKDVSLTINSGVIIKMYPGAVIQVDGSVSARGTELENVVFTSIDDPDLGGGGITGSGCYWNMIDISATGNFTASYTKLMYGKKIFNVQGTLDIYFTQISHGSLNGINVEATGFVSGSDSVIKYCSNAIYSSGQVALANSSITDCEADSGLSSGVRPFGIEKQDLIIGRSYILKYGAGGQYCGNFDALALGGTGASSFEDKIINGYSDSLKIGDFVTTEPGNMRNPTIRGVNTLIEKCTDNCTFENHKSDCPRIITIIMAESLKVNGRKDVKIAGLPQFFLENVEYKQGHTEITAKYIGSPRISAPGIIVASSGTFYGTSVNFERCSKGIEVYGTVSLTNCKLANCGYGLYFDTIQPSFLYYNSFVNNTIYGAYNNKPSEIVHDLSSSYWGSADGPSVYDETSQAWIGSGDKVGKGINFSDWLSSDPNI